MAAQEVRIIDVITTRHGRIRAKYQLLQQVTPPKCKASGELYALVIQMRNT